MSRSGREVLPENREWSGDCNVWSGNPPGCPGVVGRPSLMYGSGQEASRVVGRPTRMSGSGREALPENRDWSGDCNVWSGGSPGCPGMISRPPWMSGSGRKTLLDVREWSGGPPGCLGVFGKPS